MIVNPITDGIVLDHITAGRGMELYRILGLDTLDCEVALIKNAQSVKMGRKDIIKVDRLIDVNLDAIGYVDPGITVNVIQDGKLVERKHIAKPDTITNVIKCKNPRCITTVEQEIPHVFKLVDRDAGVYRCIYCESKAK